MAFCAPVHKCQKFACHGNLAKTVEASPISKIRPCYDTKNWFRNISSTYYGPIGCIPGEISEMQNVFTNCCSGKVVMVKNTVLLAWFGKKCTFCWILTSGSVGMLPIMQSWVFEMELRCFRRQLTRLEASEYTPALPTRTSIWKHALRPDQGSKTQQIT